MYTQLKQFKTLLLAWLFTEWDLIVRQKGDAALELSDNKQIKLKYSEYSNSFSIIHNSLNIKTLVA